MRLITSEEPTEKKLYKSKLLCHKPKQTDTDKWTWTNATKNNTFFASQSSN